MSIIFPSLLCRYISLNFKAMRLFELKFGDCIKSCDKTPNVHTTLNKFDLILSYLIRYWNAPPIFDELCVCKYTLYIMPCESISKNNSKCDNMGIGDCYIWSYLTHYCLDSSYITVQGWGLLNQFSPFPYFPHFPLLSKQTLAIEYRVHIW